MLTWASNKTWRSVKSADKPPDTSPLGPAEPRCGGLTLPQRGVHKPLAQSEAIARTTPCPLQWTLMGCEFTG